jgi:hypothetical protein
MQTTKPWLIIFERKLLMKINVGGKEIALRDSEVVIARKAVNNFLECIRAGSNKLNLPSMYFTMLVVMYKKSYEILDALTPEALQIFMDVAARSEVQDIDATIFTAQDDEMQPEQ